MSRKEELRARADVLAAMSGAIEALYENNEEVSTEYLKNRLNAELEEKGVESDILKVGDE